MPGICRQDQDSAGGTLLSGSPNVFVNLSPAVRVGDAVQSHDDDDPHRSATMAQGSDSVRVNSVPVCRAGDLASCGDVASGSDNVRAG